MQCIPVVTIFVAVEDDTIILFVNKKADAGTDVVVSQGISQSPSPSQSLLIVVVVPVASYFF